MRRYVAVIDCSGSMGEEVRGKGKSRWNYAQESMLAFARKCEEFGGTLDVYTFNGHYKHFPKAGADKVKEVFNTVSPMGGTDFVPVLTHVFQEHFNQPKGDAKPTTVVILTDGEPSDGVSGQKATAKCIIEATKKMEGDAELGLEFLQVGEDPKAKAFLTTLDDDLTGAGAKFDIVDTKTTDELEQKNLTIEDVLLAAVND